MRWLWVLVAVVALLQAQDAVTKDETFLLYPDHASGLCLASSRPALGVWLGLAESPCVGFVLATRDEATLGFVVQAAGSKGGACLDLGARSYFEDDPASGGELPVDPERWSIWHCTGTPNQRFYQKIDGRLCVTGMLGNWCLKTLSRVDNADAPSDLASPTAGDELVRTELRRWGGGGSRLQESHRWATLAQMLSAASARLRLHAAEVRLRGTALDNDSLAPEASCPESGAGVGVWATEMEEHHFKRHNQWATMSNFCRAGTGLWTSGCGVECPLRAAVVATTVGLRPGDLVLDVGSGCGHYAKWLHRWFGARTLGVDFVEDAVAFAQATVTPVAPARFCWFNVASEGLGFVPPRSVDLAIAVSVVHYLRTDTDTFERPRWRHLAERNETAYRTPCDGLPVTTQTQCAVARGMFRAVRPGGHVWIAHNGCYMGKWDPRKVWGPQYWQCCFGPELRSGEAVLQELPELELFMYAPNYDPTYSVVLRRIK